MASSHKSVMLQATFSQIIPAHSSKTPQRFPPVTQVPDSQTKSSAGSLPAPSLREGSIVQDSYEHQPPAEDSPVRGPAERLEDDELDTLSDRETSLNRLRTSPTRKSAVTATDTTTPTMPPKASSQARRARRSVGSAFRNKPSQIIYEISNNGNTSSVAALKDMRAGRFSQPQPSQQSAPTTEIHSQKPAPKPSAAPVRQSQAIPTKRTVHHSKKDSKSAPVLKRSAASDPEFDVPESEHATPSKPLKPPKSSVRSSPKRRGRSRKKPAARAANKGDDDDYSDPKATKTKAPPPVRKTRASTRAQTAKVTQAKELSHTERQPTPRTYSNRKRNSSQRSTKTQATRTRETYGDFENIVTNLNNDGAAEVQSLAHPQVAESLALQNRLDRNVVAAVQEVKRGRVETPNQPSAFEDIPATGATSRRPIPIDDDQEDDDDDDDDPSPSGQISYADANGQDSSLQSRNSLKSPSMAPRNPPQILDQQQTDQTENDALAKERASRKPNIISFNDRGPRNQGSLSSKDRLRLPPQLHTPVFDPAPGDGDAPSLVDENTTYESFVEAEPVKKPADDAEKTFADVLLSKRPPPEELVSSKVHVEGARDAVSRSRSHTEKAGVAATATAKSSEYARPAPAAAIAPGAPTSKRPNAENDSRATKRARNISDEKHGNQPVQPSMRDDHGQRKWSQHTVTDAGSPMRAGNGTFTQDTTTQAAAFFKRAQPEPPLPRAEQKDPLTFFPGLASLNRKRQQTADATGDQKVFSSGHGHTHDSPDIESQAVSHVGLGELTEYAPTEGREHDAQEPSEYPFQSTQVDLICANPTQKEHSGFMDMMRSKIVRHASGAETGSARSGDAQEEQENHEAMDEDDPEKTLVNDDPDSVRDDDDDDDSAGSSDTDAKEKHQDASTVWRNALEPHQGDVHDALIRVAHGFLVQLVDHETSIQDMITDFGGDGVKLIKQLEAKHEEELDEYSRRVRSGRDQLVHGLHLTEKSLIKDFEEVAASGRKYIETWQQGQADVSKKLGKMIQAYM